MYYWFWAFEVDDEFGDSDEEIINFLVKLDDTATDISFFFELTDPNAIDFEDLNEITERLRGRSLLIENDAAEITPNNNGIERIGNPGQEFGVLFTAQHSFEEASDLEIEVEVTQGSDLVSIS